MCYMRFIFSQCRMKISNIELSTAFAIKTHIFQVKERMQNLNKVSHIRLIYRCISNRFYKVSRSTKNQSIKFHIKIT